MCTLWPGHANPNTSIQWEHRRLCTNSTEEKDLGVVINQSLSPSHHIATCVSRANRSVGLIKRTYENKSKRNIIALYKSLVRPHLEYCVQAWRPHNQKDIDNLEGAHRRMTKMINGMGEDEYNLRLSKTKLLSLEMRRLRSDLIKLFKIMHNLEGVKREDFFQLRTDTGRRGHSLSDHSQTALQTECAEIFLHTSSSGYLEQDEWGYSEQQDSEQLQKSDWPMVQTTRGGAIHKPTKASCSRHSDPQAPTSGNQWGW